jgi:hypothetical protein
MAKFNTQTKAQNPLSFVATEPAPLATVTTYEGGRGYVRDAKSELFLLAVSNMVSENTFYEKADERDDRYERLVSQVAVADPVWISHFLYWLRTEANMRSASLVGAALAVHARRQARLTHSDSTDVALAGSSITDRVLINRVLQRADEPGEFLAFWMNRFGNRKIPSSVKRGVGDAILRLGSEFNYVKWDSESRGIRFADILNLCHPGDVKNNRQFFKGEWQKDLFGYIVKKPYEDGLSIPDSLGTLTRRQILLDMPVNERRSILESPEVLAQAGMTWESLAGWLQGPMDASAWEAIIPSMGYMALLRNLRNFDHAGVSDKIADAIIARLSDPEQVQKSRQLPMRFLSAYKAAPSLRWAGALEKALNLSLSNVPVLSGRTLILVDRSGSMFQSMSARSDLTQADAAAIFGSALALRAESADLVEFGSTAALVPFRRGDSVLRMVEKFHSLGGTETASAVQKYFKNHDRVVIITDEQASGYYGSDPLSYIPESVPTITFNLVGYRYGHGPANSTNRITIGGLSDRAFKIIPLLEVDPEEHIKSLGVRV